MKYSFLSAFRKPTAKAIAQQNLEEAQRQLLTQEAAAAYHAKMAEYHRDSITRLIAHIRAD